LHGTDITLVGNEPSFLPMVKFSIEQSDGITAVSNYLADVTRREFTINKEINVIPNFVDTGFFQKHLDFEFRRKLAKDEQFILMHISNFRPLKRMEDLIRILLYVREDFDAVLVLVGDGPMRSKLEILCRRERIRPWVIFLGKQLGVMELLSLADVYLSTSQMESFGLSALEAMSCSVPVVATKVGGVPEVITDREEGFLEEVGEVEALASRVKQLLADRKLRQKMGEKARLKAIKRFNVNAIVGQYEDYYRKVVEGNH
jgi:N-acetyl-alpha-D-glucosaminyl L-malate synthase BshA